MGRLLYEVQACLQGLELTNANRNSPKCTLVQYEQEIHVPSKSLTPSKEVIANSCAHFTSFEDAKAKEMRRLIQLKAQIEMSIADLIPMTRKTVPEISNPYI
jgi:hypothetical protein